MKTKHITHAKIENRNYGPSLVALYDIRPGNGAGQFLQPQSPRHTGLLWQRAAYCIARLKIKADVIHRTVQMNILEVMRKSELDQAGPCVNLRVSAGKIVVK